MTSQNTKIFWGFRTSWYDLGVNHSKKSRTLFQKISKNPKNLLIFFYTFLKVTYSLKMTWFGHVTLIYRLNWKSKADRACTKYHIHSIMKRFIEIRSSKEKIWWFLSWIFYHFCPAFRSVLAHREAMNHELDLRAAHINRYLNLLFSQILSGR